MTHRRPKAAWLDATEERTEEMIALDNFEEVKRRHESLKRAHAEKVGAFGEMKKGLKDEFGCSTIKEGADLLETLTQQEQETLRSWNTDLESYVQELDAYESKTEG